MKMTFCITPFWSMQFTDLLYLCNILYYIYITLILLACWIGWFLQNNLLKRTFGNFRYVELNTRFSGGYKRYNETIPKYLQDKPRQFLKHCLERITTAKDIRPEFIKDGEKWGEFVIQSTQTKNTWYNLSFGGTDGMPRCSCPDFSHTGFLCKHFFAVFEHRDNWK